MTLEFGPNITTVFLALFVALPGLLAAYYARKSSLKTDETHVLVNGQMEAFRRVVEARGSAESRASRSDGFVQGEQAERDRQSTPPTHPADVTIVNPPDSPVPVQPIDKEA